MSSDGNNNNNNNNDNNEERPSSSESHNTSIEELKNKLDGCQAYYERMLEKAKNVPPIARVEPTQRHDFKPTFLKSRTSDSASTSTTGSS